MHQGRREPKAPDSSERGRRLTSGTARYRIYGLSIQSPLPLPARRVTRPGRADVQLIPSPAGRFPRPSVSPRKWFHYQPSPLGGAYLLWRDLFEFLVSADGHTIRYRRLPDGSPESLSAYLLGQVLSFSMLAFGSEPLHGTAVVVDGRAVVLLGDCGAGKSTLGAAMLGRGYPILTDDLVAVSWRGSTAVVEPGPPRIKLYRPVARRLLGDRAGPAMNRHTAKLILPLEADETAGRSVPLRGFYVIDRAAPRGGEPGIGIDPLRPGQALLELARASFNLIVTDRRRLRNQFAFDARLAAAVPVKRLTYPRSLSALSAVCDMLLNDVRA